MIDSPLNNKHQRDAHDATSDARRTRKRSRTTSATITTTPPLTRHQRETCANTSAINTEHHACTWGFHVGMFCTGVLALASLVVFVVVLLTPVVALLDGV